MIADRGADLTNKKKNYQSCDAGNPDTCASSKCVRQEGGRRRGGAICRPNAGFTKGWKCYNNDDCEIGQFSCRGKMVQRVQLAQCVSLQAQRWFQGRHHLPNE